jgi:hypothetical protein
MAASIGLVITVVLYTVLAIAWRNYNGNRHR